MEIGVIVILLGIFVLSAFCENTKIGNKFIKWFGKKFFDVDLEG